MAQRTQLGKAPAFGRKILGCIRDVLQLCEEVGERIGFPGEGGERRFRAWLASDLLQETLGWPAKNVLVGERFDILLINEENHALATIETKTPFHKASKKDRADFEERLSGFATLRTAYFTNGPEWDRLDIIVTGGDLQILERSRLDIRKASAELTEFFFAPLRFDSVKQDAFDQVYHVNRDNPFIGTTLSRLAADLDQTVADFTLFYRQLFWGLREGRAGKAAQEIATAVYSQWCGQSLRVTPTLAAQTLIRVFKEDSANPASIARTLAALGLDGPSRPQVVEAVMSLALEAQKDESALIDALWPAFGPSIDQLSAQTAHVILGRVLLYRVGEDEAVFERMLSGMQLRTELDSPGSRITGPRFRATELLETVRTRMQTFLPAVYLRGEFDWWVVLPEKRASLGSSQLAWLREYDEEMEKLTRQLLRRLNHYQFESVDVDIWRNIYENYLPEDERQRLGGFYTPDELVNLVLDLDGFTAESEGLCELSYIDPACGSGAFVTTALARLLSHLDLDLACHSAGAKRKEPEWKRAEQKLRLVADRVHAIDLHPFASFLTTLNVLFMLLPLYVKARDKDPHFIIDLLVFSADSLERPERKTQEQIHMFAQMNSRIQLSADSYERYRRIMDTRFDRVFGNPPWGGVLKGPLAPVYDSAKKKHFSDAFPSAAKGKYDVYGLFIERSLQLLKPKGKFALLTQDTFLDKEWAAELRKMLASKSKLEYIVDLNPFGQLFFHAMNAPCITVGTKTQWEGSGNCVCVISEPPKDFKELDTQQRRERVAQTIRDVLGKLPQEKKRAKVFFASGVRVDQQRLQDTAEDRWDLSGGPGKEIFPEGWFTAAELLEMRQGVTPGGCLDVFLMDEKKAEHLKLEAELIRKAIKSKQLERWRIEWKNRVLFYPYRRVDEKSGTKFEPAFTIQWDEIEGSKMKKRLLDLKVDDALDFDQQIDGRETEIVKRGGINNQSVKDLLKHRISLGLVKYPNAATYLVESYESLEGRVFEKKRFTQMGKRWYEYHRPRDATVMLGKPRILSPRLVRKVRFVLDSDGYLSDDGCVMLQPTGKTRRAWGEFEKAMNSTMGEPLTEKELLQYCLAFLNSAYAQNRLVTGHRPTPKGSYAVTEKFLREIPIPTPTDESSVRKIIGLVDKLERRPFALTDKREVEIMEGKLQEAVERALKAADN